MITIEKAIPILEDLLTEGPYFDPELRRQAVKLAIEALKAVEQSRRQQSLWLLGPLPGEKKE